MLAHELVVRPTQDLDLFTPVSSEVDPLVAALAEALLGQDAQVEVDRRGSGFSRLTVQTVDGRQVAVEIAHDARLRDSVQLDFGRVLHPDEVAADKTLALFGRAAARDHVDVAALTARYFAAAAVCSGRGEGRWLRPRCACRCDERGRRAPEPRLCRARTVRRGDPPAPRPGPGMARLAARHKHGEPEETACGTATSNPSPASRARPSAQRWWACRPQPVSLNRDSIPACRQAHAGQSRGTRATCHTSPRIVRSRPCHFAASRPPSLRLVIA